MDSSNNSNSQSSSGGMLQDSQFISGIIKPRMLAASPTMAAGDTYFVNAQGIFQRLPAGTAGQVLEVVNGIPTWTTSSGGNATTLNGYPANATPTANNIPVLDSAGNLPVGTYLGYAAVTASQNTITSEVDLTSLAITVAVPAGRKVLITACIEAYSSAAGIFAELHINESTTQLQSYAFAFAYSGVQTTGFTQVYLTSSAGSHTYKLTLQRTGGAVGTVSLFAGATFPSYIMAELI